jgi:anti-anti-sigma factor
MFMTPQPVCVFAFETDPNSRVTVISLTGQLDPVATDELAPRIDEAVRAGARRFVFDLSGLVYVGSMGLQLFLSLHNRLRGEGAVALSGLTPPVLAVLDVTKLSRVLRHYPTRREAIDAVTV